MNTMKWLIRREYWENKGMFLRLPVIVGLAMLAFVCLSLIWGGVHGMENGAFGGHANAMPAALKAEMIDRIANGYMVLSAPIFLCLSLVVFFYCLAALHDERRDRSILFWKSLPVSDRDTVLSKVAAALAMAPFISMVVAILTALLLLLLVGVGMAMGGTNIFGALFASPAFYLTPLQALAMLPVYALWALPTVGWLLMVSSWAKSKPFLWAVGTPVLVALTIKWVNWVFGFGWDVKWFVNDVVMRGLGGLFPGAWFSFVHVSAEQLTGEDSHMLMMSTLVRESWLTLAKPDVWVGVAAGALMIFVAMRMRRWRDEG
jgi:ABC-2 type transport system permease protein